MRTQSGPDIHNREIKVIGGRRTPIRDFYHAFLRARWWAALGLLVLIYLFLNACFAFGYWAFGGIAGAAPGSFADAFFFSVQTMGTIGYGGMHPVSRIANVLVVAEAVVGMLVTALATGLVFTKFSRSTSRVIFSNKAVIHPVDGVPTLMFRLGNERSNQIMDTEVRVSMVRAERTSEGTTLYRMHDLVLVRSRAPSLSHSWAAMHSISSASPLHGHTPRTMEDDEIELIVSMSGIDDTSLQVVHATRRYRDDEIIWGARFADLLVEDAGGDIVLNLSNFHALHGLEPTSAFPYSMDTGRTLS